MIVSSPAKQPTPKLRRDLKLYSGPHDHDNGPTWTLHDPLRNRFFRLQWLDKVLLSHWNTGEAKAIISAIHQETGIRISSQQIQKMGQFLASNTLLTASNQQASNNLWQQSNTIKTSVGNWLLHHYLFFKIPLFKPDRFLRATLPFVGFIYSPVFLFLLTIAGMLGLYLTIRQWEVFIASIETIFSTQGVLWYFAALLLVKTSHELGHAITACRFGCRIPTIGVAFMVMFPVLYTDTSEVWKLRSMRERLAIGSAGVGAELLLALLATILWSFLPPGDARNSVVMVATITWITSLTINLNPLMRFDGYYLLADLLAMDNLQDRAFALGRWQLRQWLLGLREPAPEYFTAKRRTTLLIYAYATWIYRLLLFLAIALLVYHFLFKLAGLFLMAVELLWFIILPIARELKVWWLQKNDLSWNRHTVATLLGLAGIAIILATPWQEHMEAPALLTAKQNVRLYAPTPARLRNIYITKGQQVAAGESLLTLAAPDLEHEIVQINHQIADLQWQNDHAMNSQSMLENSLIRQKEMGQLLSKRAGLLDRKIKLHITAPFAGRVTDIENGLLPGRWLAAKQPLLELATINQQKIIAYIPEAAINRAHPGLQAEFQANDRQIPPINATIIKVDSMAMDTLEKACFASIYGGDIPVWQDARGRMIPVAAVYRLTLDIPQPHMKISNETIGTIKLPITKKTILHRVWQQVGQVLIRESGF